MTEEAPPAPFWLVTVSYSEIVTFGEHTGIRHSDIQRVVQGINLADALNVAVPLIRDQIRPASFASIIVESVPGDRVTLR